MAPIFSGWHFGTFLALLETSKKYSIFMHILRDFWLFSSKKFFKIFLHKYCIVIFILKCHFAGKYLQIFSQNFKKFSMSNKMVNSITIFNGKFPFFDDFSLKIRIWHKFGTIRDRVWHQTSIFQWPPWSQSTRSRLKLHCTEVFEKLSLHHNYCIYSFNTLALYVHDAFPSKWSQYF